MPTKEEIAEVIGQSVHVALRKYVDCPESAVAWNAINDMPDEDWDTCVTFAAEQVLRLWE